MSKISVRSPVVAGFLAAIVAALVVGVFLGNWAERRREEQSREQRVRTGIPATRRDSSEFTEGSWGLVRYWKSMQEMPPELVQLHGPPGTATEWYFGQRTPAEITQALIQCGMQEKLAADLSALAEPWPHGGYVLKPSDAQVLALTPGVREKLYALLQGWPQNAGNFAPIRYEKAGTHDWLYSAQLSPRIASTVQHLIYRHNNLELFTDFDLVMRQITNPGEAREFLRVMTRQTTIMACLIVRPNDDLDALTRYWGCGGREGEVRPLLELARMSDGRTDVPLNLLLPRFARDHIYRYRLPTDPGGINCHYSSMNFFNENADTNYTSLAACSRDIDNNYFTVTNSLQFGDVLLFMRDGHQVLHSCNVITTGLVFTKNGNSIGQPWIIADLADLKAYYELDGPLAIRAIRRREVPQPPTITSN